MREFWISKHYFDAPRKMVFDSPPDTDLPVDHVISYDAFDSLLKDAQGLVEALEKTKDHYWNRCNQGQHFEKVHTVASFDEFVDEALQSFQKKWGGE